MPSAALPPPTAARAAPTELLLSVIDPNPYQPRSESDAEALSGLVESVKQYGVVEPVVVRPSGSGRYQLVAGQRRYLAAREAGLSHIPALVRDLSDEDTLVISLVENLQREDLSPLDEARAFQLLSVRFNLTHEAVARAVGRTRSYVTNSLRLLSLEEPALGALQSGELSRGQALALLALPRPERKPALARIRRQKLSVRQVEEMAQRARRKERVAAGTAAIADPYLHRVVDELEGYLGTRVRVRRRGDGGELVISYSSPGDLNRLLRLLKPTENPY